MSIDLRLLEKSNIFLGNITTPSEIARNGLHGHRPVEYNVGRVLPVMPIGEERVVRLEHRHDTKPSAGSEQPIKLPKLLVGMMEMLNNFRARDEIIRFFGAHFDQAQKTDHRSPFDGLLRASSGPGPGQDHNRNQYRKAPAPVAPIKGQRDG